MGRRVGRYKGIGKVNERCGADVRRERRVRRRGNECIIDGGRQSIIVDSRERSM